MAVGVDIAARRIESTAAGPSLPPSTVDAISDVLISVKVRDQTVLDDCAEYTIGAKLQKALDASPAMQPTHTVSETHRLARVRDPVLRGADTLGRYGLAGEVGNNRDLRLAEGEILEHRGELLKHRIHPRGMKRVTDPQSLGFCAFLRPGIREIQDGGLLTRDHNRGGPVDRSQSDPTLIGLDRFHHLAL